MKNREEEIILDCPVMSTTQDGKGVVKIDGRVIFVDFAVEGDIVDIRVKRRSKKYLVGEIVRISTPSPNRVQAHCEHFGKCGGCKLQYIDYAKQLEIKSQHVRDALERIGKVEIESFLPIQGSAENRFYRNKLDYAFSSKRWLTIDEIQTLPENVDRSGLGFHMPGMFDKVLDVTYCYHQIDPSNAIRDAVKEYARKHEMDFYDIRMHSGLLRNMIIRSSSLNQWMVIIAFTELNEKTKGLLEFVKNKFPEIKSLQYAINNKKNDVIYDLDLVTYAGEDFIYEMIGEYKFKVGAKSFFQTNSAQAKVLYDITRDFANIQPNEIVYDLYTGVGSIGIYCSKNAQKVIGIELVEAAIADAKINAALNNIENCSFFASDMRKLFDASFIAKHGKPDVIITDPPRAGMDEPVVQTLLDTACKRIVYVSCNPSTQARDLELLSAKYRVVKVQPVDMFPHTVHVESVALLELKTTF
ncbi:MAG: 23S rRNA (uracil(1939)-C(5))-methyltransferase RlmD [Bacteroidetes bacterium]|nr:23S rRNA (uracil(1939)-C(5))-methyltransferase RlmD [Bacteroidota bacterium]